MPFATEFPVKAGLDSRMFVAQIITWLKGTQYSRLFENNVEIDLDGDSPLAISANGEELRLRVLKVSGAEKAVGFRHDFPDQEGRLWRTESVLLRNDKEGDQSIVRFRTQCIARESGAKLHHPRKPYIIKSFLVDRLSGTDGQFLVSDEPVWLKNNDDSLQLAESISLGKASNNLPIIYISTIKGSSWPFNRKQVDKLAYELGGVAHVVVEPDRDFSITLRDLTSGQNVYGGAIGIALPNYGFVRRLFASKQSPGSRNLVDIVHDTAHALRSQMPSCGWDWTELQEQSLRQHRQRERNRLTSQEERALYEEENENLRETIVQLKDDLARQQSINSNNAHENYLHSYIASQV